MNTTGISPFSVTGNPQTQLKGRRVYFSSQPVITAGVFIQNSHIFLTSEQEAVKTQGQHLSDPLPPSKPRLPKFPQTSKTAPPAGDQELKQEPVETLYHLNHSRDICA